MSGKLSNLVDNLSEHGKKKWKAWKEKILNQNVNLLGLKTID